MVPEPWYLNYWDFYLVPEIWYLNYWYLTYGTCTIWYLNYGTMKTIWSLF